ncbi:MAG: DUF3095 domain-containing protein [Polyangiales bacterium]
MSNDDLFYEDLAPLADFGDVADPSHYAPAPANWLLVITDVEGSTKAIEEGRYKDVNALGVASIVAIQNACSGIDLPFVFGGDGATLLCPGSKRAALESAIRGLQKRATDGFQLGMRGGIVPVGALRDAGHEVLVARFAASKDASFAMLAGSGITVGEKWVKDKVRGKEFAVEAGPTHADFEGFECRWKPIPAQNGEMLSVLVQALGDEREDLTQVYQEVIANFERILDGDGRPVATSNLQLGDAKGDFASELKLRGQGWVPAGLAMLAKNRIGQNSMDTGKTRLGFNGREYRQEVAANTDFRKFDDTLRMVIDVSTAQKDALLVFLESEREAGRLIYGVHSAKSALMTCVIRERKGNHVHFVDGANGGYALAAKQLKAML